MEKLTKKQSGVLDFIKKSVETRSYPPTYKEIAEKFGNNVNAIQQVIIALVKKGYVEKTGGVARGLRVKENIAPAQAKSNIITIPLYGNVAAGEPVFADDNIEGYVAVEKPGRTSGTMFAVTVRGDSMIEKRIVEKDKLIVRKQNTANDGDIVVALLDDEVTVKLFKKNGGRPYLQPANSRYDPIRKPFKILGIVVGLLRDYTTV
ncbi:MAG: transcriptional repressor LexA [Chlorobi bacterium]|nr:transcriptional repressor LexA [Chlorobiota bacterium]MCI0716558.1 transcriptional repressor LexA [Chlorobiota bacterium]